MQSWAQKRGTTAIMALNAFDLIVFLCLTYMSSLTLTQSQSKNAVNDTDLMIVVEDDDYSRALIEAMNIRFA